jgi:hypothetical protein
LKGCRVHPFGHPRIKARSTAPRGLSQPPTSFIGFRRQGIHRWLFVAWRTKILMLVLAMEFSRGRAATSSARALVPSNRESRASRPIYGRLVGRTGGAARRHRRSGGPRAKRSRGHSLKTEQRRTPARQGPAGGQKPATTGDAEQPSSQWPTRRSRPLGRAVSP